MDSAAQAAVQSQAVLLVGSTMTGPLFLNPVMPSADAQAASKAYVDTMLSTAGIPEVPPVPVSQVWGRETGQWVPISQTGGTFLPIAGGSMQGNINMSGNTITNMAAVPALPNGAAPAQWVLNQIAAVSLYQGTWNMDTYTPDLTQLQYRVNGYTWIAITTSVSGVVISPAIPGLQGQTVFNGDTVIYSTVYGEFQAIHGGGLSQPEAEALFVQLAGSQMSGALLLNSDATQPMQATTFQQLEAAVANTVTPDAPADGQAYLRVGIGTNRWVPGLPLAGGILTGALTLSGNAAQPLNAVPLQQVTSLITAGTTGLLPLSGGQMTGLMQLSGNATANLNPVPLQQLTAVLGTYAPINSPAFTGSVTIPASAAIAQPHIAGVTDGSNAAAGQVGEYLTAVGTSVGISSGAWASVASLSLTAGDWDVWGQASAAPTGSMTQVDCGFSTISNAAPSTGIYASLVVPGGLGANGVVPVPERFSLSATTTVYCNLRPTYTTGTVSGDGVIYARRRR